MRDPNLERLAEAMGLPPMPYPAQPLYDRVILASDKPGMVRGVALPDGYNWIQAKGEVLASNSDEIPVGATVLIVPGSGERVKLDRNTWVLVVEEWDCLAIVEEEA